MKKAQCCEGCPYKSGTNNSGVFCRINGRMMKIFNNEPADNRCPLDWNIRLSAIERSRYLISTYEKAKDKIRLKDN